MTNQCFSTLEMCNQADDGYNCSKVLAILYISYDHTQHPGDLSRRHQIFMFIVTDFEITTSYKSYIPLPVLQYKRAKDNNIHPYMISTREIAYPAFISPIYDLKENWNIDETLTSFKVNNTYFYLIDIVRSKNLFQRAVLENYQRNLLVNLGNNPKNKGNPRYPSPDFMRKQQDEV